MPAVPAPAKVLVTGSSGFLGSHVVKALIEKGYYVRGTVRNVQKGEYLQLLFGNAAFEYVVVEDMESPNAYDLAVQGVDAVEHTAAIVAMTTAHPDVLIKPVVAGTVGILESVKNFGPTVKRVIITSTKLAAMGPDESYWNTASIDAVSRDGINARPDLKYSASKTLAEKAAWSFVEQHKSDISFDLTTLLPPMIWGPMIHQGSDSSSINWSNGFLLAGVDQSKPKSGDELVDRRKSQGIDVRDIAALHAEMLGIESAGGERYFTIAGSWSWQDVYDALNEPPALKGVPIGQPGTSAIGDVLAPPNSTKLLKLLGRSYEEVFRPLHVTWRETVEDARKSRI